MMRAGTLDRSTIRVSVVLLALWGCGSGGSTTPGSGTGGTTGGGTGGMVATGGTVGTGGKGTGGVTSTGGTTTSGTGGVTSTGGATAGGTGGVTATGGKGSGGMAAGGAPAGGKSGSGGTGTGTGGAGGSSSMPPSDAPVPSAGCSATPTTTSCSTQNAPCTMTINGTMRQYWAQLPDKYDPTHPYPVVFQYHPLGGNGWQGLTMYQIRPKFPAAIYVSLDGLKSGQYQGFPNTNGEDEAATRQMMAELEAKYCTDKGRYYATGFSYGGSMSYTAACNMSDVFRAIGAMSGAPISGATCTSKKPARPVAVWATHGDADTALPIDLAQPIIDALVKYNGCSSDTQPVSPSPCVEYQGCMPGYPVIWCVRPGDPHAIPSFAAGAIASFFTQF
jgi:polyhydroxybutyrate depolymerase